MLSLISMSKMVLFVSIVIIALIAFFIAARKYYPHINKKRIWISIGILVVILLAMVIPVSSNNMCPFSPIYDHPMSTNKDLYCKTICYCDGINIQDKCLGSWRKTCQNTP